MRKSGFSRAFRQILLLMPILIAVVSCRAPLQSETESTVSSSLRVLDPPRSYAGASWTFVFYFNADNGLESAMIEDMAELKRSVRSNESTRILVLIDRAPKHSADEEVFGENFEGSRLYEFREEGLIRLGGGEFLPELRADQETELDMGSIQNLKGLIQFAKFYYPADHYALVMGNHGSGVGDYPAYGTKSKGISLDDTEKTYISIGDFRSGLTAEESVDLIMFDACFMNYAEIGYQIAPTQDGRAASGFSADYMVASPVEVVGEGFPYDAFLEKYYQGIADASNQGLTGEELGRLMLDAQREHLATAYGPNPTDYYARSMSYTLLDLGKLDAFKARLDALAPKIASEKDSVIRSVFGNSDRTNITNQSLIDYFPQDFNTWELSAIFRAWIYYPGVDACSFLEQLKANADFAEDAAQIDGCMAALDAAVLDSFGGAAYTGFVAGTHGLALFFPKGNIKFAQQSVWSHCSAWYNPTCLSWCSNVDGSVDPWYGMLDSWWSADSAD
jgi:clostripain